MIRVGGDVVLRKTQELFNAAIRGANVHKEWKNVIPIFKKRDKRDLVNYRLFSLLSHIYNLFPSLCL